MASNERNDKSWVKVLSDIQGGRSDQPVGEGWKTSKELKEIYDCGMCRLYDIVNKGLEEGKIEQYEGTVPSSSGRMVRRVWYRIK